MWGTHVCRWLRPQTGASSLIPLCHPFSGHQGGGLKPAPCPHLPGTTLFQASAMSSYCSYGLQAGLPASLPHSPFSRQQPGASTQNETQSISLSLLSPEPRESLSYLKQSVNLCLISPSPTSGPHHLLPRHSLHPPTLGLLFLKYTRSLPPQGLCISCSLCLECPSPDH